MRLKVALSQPDCHWQGVFWNWGKINNKSVRNAASSLNVLTFGLPPDFLAEYIYTTGSRERESNRER